MQALLATALIAGIPAYAQKDAPEIRFDSVPNALQLPAGLYLGEVAGVATNSHGDIFVYTRTGHPTITIGTLAALRPRRLAAVRVRPHR